MTKSLEVYIWIMGRYLHYNDIEGKYSGDKYTKQVFKGDKINDQISVRRINFCSMFCGVQYYIL
jgi:hypothetical protein